MYWPAIPKLQLPEPKQPMTNRIVTASQYRIPFIVRFATLMDEVPLYVFRYDSQRQVSQVLVDEHWVDSPEAYLNPQPGTRVTKVGGETTDDQ